MHKLCDILLDAGCSLCYMEECLREMAADDDFEQKLSVDMKRVRNRIVELCSAPYSLTVLARQAVLRAIGQGDLVAKLTS